MGESNGEMGKLSGIASFSTYSGSWCLKDSEKTVVGNLSFLQYLYFHFINFLFFSQFDLIKKTCDITLLSSLFSFFLFLFSLLNVIISLIMIQSYQ